MKRSVVAPILAIGWTPGFMHIGGWESRYGEWPWWRVLAEAAMLYVVGLVLLWGVPVFLERRAPRK